MYDYELKIRSRVGHSDLEQAGYKFREHLNSVFFQIMY